MTHIKLLLFAHLKERFGASVLELSFPEPPQVSDLKQYLLTRYPDHQALVEASRFTLNQTYVQDDAVVVSENDELALIPPVSGG